MGINQDFRDLFRLFNEHGVEYLVVGAYAVIYYTTPRYTKDIDIWVNPTPPNAHKVWLALKEFGAPLIDVTEKDFSNQEMIYQIGIKPNRIDIIMGIPGLSFHDAWLDREKSTFGGVPISLINRDDLIESKLSAARPQDRIDVDNLKRY